MKEIAIKIDENFLERVQKMVYYYKMTGNLHPDLDEAHLFLVYVLGGISKGFKEIEIGALGEIVTSK